MSDLLFKTLNVLVVVFLLVVNQRLNLFLDILGKFLDVLPILVDGHERFLVSLLDLLVLEHELD